MRSRRSTSSWSISIRFARPWRSPAARSKTRSRTSTSAARRWCARRRRTGATWGSSSIPSDYAALLAELETHDGAFCRADALRARAEGVLAHRRLRRRDLELAHRARSRRLGRRVSRPLQSAGGQSSQDLRYGENPHQQAAFYRDERPAAGGIATCRQLQGKELSYNNIADSDAAWECVKTFAEPACVIVKHANPCGVAIAASPRRRLPQRLRDRSDVGVRRHHRVQPAGRRADARGGRRAVRRGADRARLHVRRARR